jgi:hypothetical protein
MTSADMCLDCSSPETALDSSARLLDVRDSVLLDLSTRDLDWAQAQETEGDVLLRHLGFSLQSVSQPDSVRWFHATRVPKDTTFPEGILPFSSAYEVMWRLLEQLAQDIVGARGWESFKDGLRHSHTNAAQRLRLKRKDAERLAPMPDAGRIAVRGRRRLVRRMALEVLMAMVWIAVAVMLIGLRPDPALMVLGAGIIAFVAVACAFSIWNSAGIWRPAGDTVRDFVLIAAERSRRDLRAVRFGLWFAAVETILLVAWLVWTSGRDVLPEISRLSDVWLVLPVAAPSGVVAWLLVLRRRARIELATLEAARRQFDEQ